MELAAKSLREVVKRPGLDPARVDQVIWGCVSQVGEQAFNVGRWSLLQAGYPIEVPGTTVDFQCGSSQQAVHLAHGLIASGQYDIIVAGGVEAMSRVPLLSSIQNGPGEPWTDEIKEQFHPVPQGISAEEIAQRWGLSRQDLDAFSLQSHQKAAAATAAGWFKDEIDPGPGDPGRRQPGKHGQRRGHPLRHLPGEAGQPQAVVPGRWRGHRRQFQPDLRRQRRAAAHGRRHGPAGWACVPARASWPR